jgi:hypothetical protein
MAALGRTSIDLRKDAHDVTVTVRAGFDVTGFVTLDGRPGAPAGLRISLQPDASAATVTGLPAQVSRLASEMAPDGTFVIHGVLEGTYSVVVGPAQPEVSVADIRQGGASVRATGLRVGPSPMPQTEIVLNSAAAGPGGR